MTKDNKGREHWKCIYKLANNGGLIPCSLKRGHEGKCFFEGYTKPIKILQKEGLET